MGEHGNVGRPPPLGIPMLHTQKFTGLRCPDRWGIRDSYCLVPASGLLRIFAHPSLFHPVLPDFALRPNQGYGKFYLPRRPPKSLQPLHLLKLPSKPF
jgi:hypothetical protein